MSTDAEATIGQPPQRMERSLQEQDRLTAIDARTVADALEQAAAPNTRRAYAGAWAAFTAWALASAIPSCRRRRKPWQPTSGNLLVRAGSWPRCDCTAPPW